MKSALNQKYAIQVVGKGESNGSGGFNGLGKNRKEEVEKKVGTDET